MTPMTMRVLSATSSTPDEDDVLAGWPIPAGGMFRQLDMEMHMIGDSVAHQLALLYGVSAFIVPITDPDEAATYKVIWDRLVPKDIPVTEGAFDIDTRTGDAANIEFTPGEMELAEIMGMTTAPMQIFRRREMISFATTPTGFIDTTTDTYHPTARFTTRIRRPVRLLNLTFSD